MGKYWTDNEEAALRAGVSKYGTGKWAVIVKDPEFRAILGRRSNIDLKDKWRNMNKANEANQLGDENPKAITQSHTGSSNSTAGSSSKKPIKNLEGIIMEALEDLQEPAGSSKTAIAAYIRNEYWEPPHFHEVLGAELNNLTMAGKLVEMKRKYIIAPVSPPEPSIHSALEGIDLEGPTILVSEADMKQELDKEIEEIRRMTPEEAAVAAARAVAEAEAAVAAAEQAMREADEAEAVAEAAQAAAAEAAKAGTRSGRRYTQRIG